MVQFVFFELMDFESSPSDENVLANFAEEVLWPMLIMLIFQVTLQSLLAWEHGLAPVARRRQLQVFLVSSFRMSLEGVVSVKDFAANFAFPR